jgi:hypothetical protein
LSLFIAIDDGGKRRRKVKRGGEIARSGRERRRRS